MNHRQETRIQVNQSVDITLFGDPDVRLTAVVKNLSGRGLGIQVDRPVAAGTALKVELEDALLLGEVIYCRCDHAAFGQAAFYVGIQMEHALSGLSELSRIVRAFSESDVESSSQSSQAVIESRYQGQKQSH
jgi:hypothetical protein